MHEDRILDLIRQRRDHQRSRLYSLERRGLFVIALVAAVGVGVSMMVGGNMSEVWGSMLLAGLFVIVTGLLLAALLFAGATVFPLDGRHLFHSGRSERARGWDRWLTDKGFEGRPLEAFRSLLPEPAAVEPSPEEAEDSAGESSPDGGAAEGSDTEETAEAAGPPAAPAPPPMTEEEKLAHTRQRLSDFLAETVLDGQRLDLSVDPLLRAEVMDYWSAWFVAERSAGLLRRALSMALLALVLGGLTSIQLSEEIASSATSSLGAGGKGGKSGKSGKGGKAGGPDSEGGKSGKGGGPDSEGGKSGKGGKSGLEGGLEGGKSGKGGKSGLEGGGAPEPKAGKAGRGGQGEATPEGGSSGAL